MGSILVKRKPIPVRQNIDEEIVNSIVRSLEEIQALVNEINTDRDRWLDNYNEWKRCRRRTLSAIQKCQDELDTIHTYSSVGRAIGSGVRILGIVGTVVGFGMSFNPALKPLADELIKYGPYAGGAGCATAITASLVGKGFSAKVLKELKLSLEEDQRLTAELLPWFRRAAELENLLQEVFDCSVVGGISDVFTCVRVICVLCNEGKKTLEEITDVLLSSMQRTISSTDVRNLNNEILEDVLCNASSKVSTLLLGVCQSPKVQEAVRKLYVSFRRSSDLFELPEVSSFIVKRMVGQENALCSVISLTGGKPSINWTQGIFQAIDVYAKVCDFFSAIEDIKEGKSKYSEIITQTKRCLSKELETLQSHPLLRR